MGEVGGHAHGVQHMRCLDLARGAGAAGAHGDARKIESNDERLGLSAGDRDATRVRQTRHAPRKHHGIRRNCQRPPLQSVAERGECRRLVQFRGRDLRRHAEADNAGHVLRACPAPPLLAATLDQGLDPNPLAEHEGANALGAADLVGRQRHHVGAKRREIKGEPTRDLNRIAVQKAACRMDDRGRFSDRLDRAGLVIGRHQRSERPPSSEMVLGELARKRFEVDHAVAGDREAGLCSRGKICRRRARTDARSPTCSNARHRRAARQAQGHSPAAAAREDHLFGARAGERRNLFRAASISALAALGLRHGRTTDCQMFQARRPWPRAPLA